MKFCLVRGLSREKFHWDGFPEKLQAAFSNCEIELIDLPGNGDFCGVTSPTRAADYIQFLRERAQFVKTKTPVHFIAMSFAAMLGHEWAQRFPGELASLVLINSSLRPTPFYYRMRPSGLIRLVKAARTKDIFAREKQVLELTTKMLGPRLVDIANTWAEHARAQHTNKLSAFNQLWTAAQMKRNAKCPTIPYLILSSGGDELVNPRSSEELASALHVPHRIHLTAGHDLVLDDPQWVLQQLKNFY